MEVNMENKQVSKFKINTTNFKDEDDFLTYFEEYLSYCTATPFKEDVKMGEGVGTLDKMRMCSLEGFCRFIRHSPSHFYQTINTNKLQPALEFIQNAIFSLTFEAAAAGQIKESIAVRKLGLADKKETTNTEKRIVIMHTPDNGRLIEISEDEVQHLD